MSLFSWLYPHLTESLSLGGVWCAGAEYKYPLPWPARLTEAPGSLGASPSPPRTSLDDTVSTLLPTTVTLLLLPTIVTYSCYILLLPTAVTYFCHPLLLPTAVTFYCYLFLLHTTVTYCCYPLLLHTTVASWCSLALLLLPLHFPALSHPIRPPGQVERKSGKLQEDHGPPLGPTLRSAMSLDVKCRHWGLRGRTHGGPSVGHEHCAAHPPLDSSCHL